MTRRTVGLPPRSTLPRRTTRYNGVRVLDNDDGSLLTLKRWIGTYAFECFDYNSGISTRVELAPAAARRLVANLTAALRVNGHWKD